MRANWVSLKVSMVLVEFRIARQKSLCRTLDTKGALGNAAHGATANQSKAGSRHEEAQSAVHRST